MYSPFNIRGTTDTETLDPHLGINNLSTPIPSCGSHTPRYSMVPPTLINN